MKHIANVSQTPAKAQLFESDLFKGPGLFGKAELGDFVPWAGRLIEGFTGFDLLPNRLDND